MAPKQTMMFTLTVRGVITKPDTCPVSIYVSPRLTGAQKLSAFPDWLHWTRLLKEKGLRIEITSGAETATMQIDTNVLQPDLWEELFKEDTWIDPYVFPDYTKRGILSYSVRQTLSALKATYQKAGVAIGLPDSIIKKPEEEPPHFDEPVGQIAVLAKAPTSGEKEQTAAVAETPNSVVGKVKVTEEAWTNRQILQGMAKGLDIHWDSTKAQDWRDMVRIRKPVAGQWTPAQVPQPMTGQLDSEGAIIAEPDSNALHSIALPFAVFHHMPTPKYGYNRDEETDTLKLDTEKILDFHKVLSSLNSYPELLRALGLVFDLDLPKDFVQNTASSKYATFHVSNATPGWKWSIVPDTPKTETAFLNLQSGTRRLMCNSPRILDDPTFSFMTLGLVYLDPAHFGLAQVDVDGGMHKAIILSETFNPSPDQNRAADVQPQEAAHPEVFDPEATLPSLRSGGFQLYADQRGQQLLETLSRSKDFDSAVSGGTKKPFFAEDLVRGYRLDIWDSHSNAWHSLHMRKGEYLIGEKPFDPNNTKEEGFVQMAFTQPAEGAEPVTDDLYIHEAIARWAGWSLSAPMPSKHLSRYGDPNKAIPPDETNPEYYEDQPDTPFKMAVKFTVTPNSLPRLRFGTRYRFRARAVDLAGNSLLPDDAFATLLSPLFALPLDPEGFPYLRFEPVGAPLVVLKSPLAIKDEAGVEDQGSALDRIVIRTFNDDISKDNDPADTTVGDRHIVPPRTSVEMAERLGMFDDAAGKLKSDAATYQLISEREKREFNKITLEVKGHKPDDYPLETNDKIDSLRYLPDPLSRGAAIRDLPGTPSFTVGKAEPGAGAPSQICYDPLSDPNPRAGSATLISFGGAKNWEKTVGFRFALAEPQSGQKDLSPLWDPKERLLTVYLPKGQTKVVPLSSYMTSEDLKLMGAWKWLREYIERITVTNSQKQSLAPGTNIDRIAHILQRAVEGGHWMITPPRLLTLVHAVQQPIGRPEFTALNIEHDAGREYTYNPLQTAPNRGVSDPTEMAPITAWRRPKETAAHLIGALHLHGASTAKVDLKAEWKDPVDDPLQDNWTTVAKTATVDELPLHTLSEHYLKASGTESRFVGYYDPEHDQIAFVRMGDWAGYKQKPPKYFGNSMPRHEFNDTKHHMVEYTAEATSCFREYFSQDQDLKFFRRSEPVRVDVPSSARPLAPDVAYVIPTFGWERQTETNLKRSVRFGGGLRVYLHRPWFSSGADELLGVALWSSNTYGALNQDKRDKLKIFFTQWGMDPIWQTDSLTGAPTIANFPDRIAEDTDVTLEEHSAMKDANTPGRINVVGFNPEFDNTRGLWYADLTINLPNEIYTPFVRLALVRYQPHALADSMVSRVVLADFAQLTPDRSAMVTADPYHPSALRVVVSGVAPTGPQMTTAGPDKRPTQVNVRVQQRTPGIQSDLAWTDAPPSAATIIPDIEAHPELVLWAGTVKFAKPPQPGQFRLLITEMEFISGATTGVTRPKFKPPNRIVYSEIFEIDSALIGTP